MTAAELTAPPGLAARMARARMSDGAAPAKPAASVG